MAVFDFYWTKTTPAIKPVALASEKENLSVAALSTTISLSSTWPSSRKEKLKLKVNSYNYQSHLTERTQVWPTSKFPVDLVQREQTTSVSFSPWKKVIQLPNMSSDVLLKRRVKKPSLSLPKFNVWSLPLLCNVNDEEWLIRYVPFMYTYKTFWRMECVLVTVELVASLSSRVMQRQELSILFGDVAALNSRYKSDSRSVMIVEPFRVHSLRIIGFLLWRRSYEGKPCGKQIVVYDS